MSEAERLAERLEELLAKATPGPWEARRAVKPDNTGGYDWAIIAPDKAIVGECFEVVDWAENGVDFDTRPVEANARLITEAVNALPALITTLRSQAEELERLRGALLAIEEGKIERPLGSAYRADGTPSKHDLCTHGVWMYMICESCVDAHVRAALGER